MRPLIKEKVTDSLDKISRKFENKFITSIHEKPFSSIVCADLYVDPESGRQGRE